MVLVGSLKQPQPNPNRRVSGAAKTTPPYFEVAESISGLGLAQIQGFGVVLG